MALTKHLRLAAAERTDVGRRRERNQDNVTHFVPDEEDLLARRGALFVVCDGMGGHAAGEIASDIAVRTIRDEYFRESDDDVISALARAIRAANTAIYEHARAHAAHSGMGTTCVALALVGGRAFFANIGDSRGYILREGALRQVTLDHSWVAEQVRAGVLTDEQARTHTHRNVITRSLGTQPEVVADLFIETMREGDRVLLCSDGLHGYVPESEIQRVVVSEQPEPGVHLLVDMANANGGPDNITAVVVHLLEVPEVTEELKLPEAVTVTRGPRTSAALAARATVIDRPAMAPPHVSQARPAASVAAARSQRARPRLVSVPVAPEWHRAMWPVVALRVLAVAALCLLSLGVWDVLAGPYAVSSAASARARQDIASAQAAARAANSQDPRVALAALAGVRQRLQHDLTTLPLDDQGRQQIRQTLDAVVAPAVRAAVQTYNAESLITVLPASAVTTYPVACGSATLASGPAALAAIGPAKPPAGQTLAPVTIYAQAGEGALYQMDLAAGSATCGVKPVVAQGVLALATDATQLYALAHQATTWTVLVVAGGKAAAKLTLPADQTHTPSALAARGGDFYVAFQNPQTGGGGIWHYSGSNLTKPVTIPTPTAVVSLSVAASGVPFAVLEDGTLVRWDAAGHVTTVPIYQASPVLATDPNAYLSATPVPTVPPTPTSVAPTATPEQASSTLVGNGTPSPSPSHAPTATATAAPTATPPLAGPTTRFSGSTALAADRASSLVIGDGTVPRVVRFTVTGPTLQLAQQYVYGPTLAPLQSVTLSADGTRVFAWSGAQLVEVTLPA
jgi:serine/threonine protein phosphatase PrpC